MPISIAASWVIMPDAIISRMDMLARSIHIHLQFISHLLCGGVGIDRSNFFESFRLRDIEGIKQVSYFWVLLADFGSILRR